MYATAWCPYCAKARAYFSQSGIAYTERDIERSAAAYAEFKRLGGRGVPLILVGSEKMAGFSELAFESLLVRASRAR
jgi:glutaredoxin